MALPPFDIAQTLPGDTDLISVHPAAARTFRDVVESWLLLVSDTYGRVKIAKGDTAARDALVGKVDGTLFINTDFTPLLLQRWDGAAWANLGAVASTESAQGLIEIATQAEVNTGTDDARAITPAKLKAYAPPMDTVTLELGQDKLLVRDNSDTGKWKLAAAAEAGLLLQRVWATPYTTHTETSALVPRDNTIPQSSEGTEFLTATITPKMTTSRLRIRVYYNGSYNANGGMIGALFRDAGADALVSRFTAIFSNSMASDSLEWEVASGATAATTFKFRLGGDSVANTRLWVNGLPSGQVLGGTLAFTMCVEEILA